MAVPSILTVDLSPFLNAGDENCKKRAIDEIAIACSEYGFFQIVNHGVPLGLVRQVLKLSRTFFEQPTEEKLESSPKAGTTFPAGYYQIKSLIDNNESLMMFPPGSSLNVLPENPPKFREALEEIFLQFSKVAQLLQGILNDCLELPPNFLNNYNNDRKADALLALHYPPLEETNNNVGRGEHKDTNFLTLVLQDEVGGLEVQKDGKWIPIPASEGALVVNVGDVIQVLSNEKFVSANHRVVRNSERSRYSLTFFHALEGDKWVEPLSQFTKETGEPPKYRGFFYKEYAELRMKNRTHPPSRLEEVIGITYYAIPQ